MLSTKEMQFTQKQENKMLKKNKIKVSNEAITINDDTYKWEDKMTENKLFEILTEEKEIQYIEEKNLNTEIKEIMTAFIETHKKVLDEKINKKE